MTVRVEGVDHSPFEGVKVYAFDGTTYKGYSGISGKDGQVTFTLPQGNYRFRGDLNGTQFWSSTENACTLPGCASAAITLPGGNTSRSAVTINYTYDGLSRLTAADYSSGDYYHYAYDAVGNRLNETTAKGETAYTYDPANRLTSVNGQAVQWDDNGNMLADGQAVYKYNTANKLVGVTKGTSNIVYAYSGLGDRLKQIADGVTTDYVLDINAGLTQVLQDNTNKYVYGNQRISQIAETQTGYFLPDALGSMRQMTDPSADLTLARTYDPYGNVVSSSGAGETVYGYTGEMQSNGLVHLRARDYKSQLGRFTSRDTWEGDKNKPSSYNTWIYAFDTPIIFKDPSGLSPKVECSYINFPDLKSLCELSNGDDADPNTIDARWNFFDHLASYSIMYSNISGLMGENGEGYKYSGEMLKHFLENETYVRINLPENTDFANDPGIRRATKVKSEALSATDEPVEIRPLLYVFIQEKLQPMLSMPLCLANPNLSDYVVYSNETYKGEKSPRPASIGWWGAFGHVNIDATYTNTNLKYSNTGFDITTKIKYHIEDNYGWFPGKMTPFSSPVASKTIWIPHDWEYSLVTAGKATMFDFEINWDENLPIFLSKDFSFFKIPGENNDIPLN